MSYLIYSSLEEPVTIMRTLTNQGKSFSVSFVKLDGSIAYIDKATLRKMSGSGKNSRHILNLVNTENQEKRKAYIPLLLGVNGIKVNLRR